MPTYEYACKKCGEQFDVVQSFSDEPLKRHKGCGGAVRRVFGSVGISFKGSGFYKNDSRSSSSKSPSASSSSESKADAKSESTSEKKSESKSESASTNGKDAKKETKSEKKAAPTAS
jgi:putative FmdB family regulatory protein